MDRGILLYPPPPITCPRGLWMAPCYFSEILFFALGLSFSICLKTNLLVERFKMSILVYRTFISIELEITFKINENLFWFEMIR